VVETRHKLSSTVSAIQGKAASFAGDGGHAGIEPVKNATIQTTLLLVFVAGLLPAATFSTLPSSGLVTGAPGQDARLTLR